MSQFTEFVDDRLYAAARHDLLHETNREEVISDIIHWLDGVTARENQ